MKKLRGYGEKHDSVHTQLAALRHIKHGVCGGRHKGGHARRACPPSDVRYMWRRERRPCGQCP